MKNSSKASSGQGLFLLRCNSELMIVTQRSDVVVLTSSFNTVKKNKIAAGSSLKAAPANSILPGTGHNKI